MKDELEVLAAQATDDLSRMLNEHAAIPPPLSSVVRTANRRRRVRIMVPSGIAICLLLVGMFAAEPIHRRPASTVTAAEPAAPTGSKSGISPYSEQPSSSNATSSCDIGAVAHPDMAKDDPQGRRRGNYPPAQAPPPGVSPLTKDEAVAAAREYRDHSRTDAKSDNDYTATAAEVRYGDFAAGTARQQDPFISPSRCIWVVTVEAPFTVTPPPGTQAPTYRHYQVVLDAGSRQMIELHAMP